MMNKTFQNMPMILQMMIARKSPTTTGTNPPTTNSTTMPRKPRNNMNPKKRAGRISNAEICISA